jgi:hypothetical protein
MERLDEAGYSMNNRPKGKGQANRPELVAEARDEQDRQEKEEFN